MHAIAVNVMRTEVASVLKPNESHKERKFWGLLASFYARNGKSGSEVDGVTQMPTRFFKTTVQGICKPDFITGESSKMHRMGTER